MNVISTAGAPAPLCIFIASLVAGCAASRATIADLPPARTSIDCRTPIALAGNRSSEPIAWIAPLDQHDRLDAWCATTGPPVVEPLPARLPDAASGIDALAVVTWNLHGGAADLGELVRRLKAGSLTNGRRVERFVLLLQEAYRADRAVPDAPVPGVRPPRPVGVGGFSRADVVLWAESLGLALYYVPSMRNGPPPATQEDRGNAILSTEPLSNFEAIELPLERQRRVAIAAAISGRSPAGTPWTLRVVSAHLESSAPARKLWVLATGPRHRQAHGLLDALEPDRPIVLGGDFNSWFGSWEPAYRTVAAALPDISRRDGRATYGRIFRLDHLFSRLPDGWSVTVARLDDRMGSDHFPILASFQLPKVNVDAQ